jgi:hypothetical protein
VPSATVTAKADILVGASSGVVDNLPVGTNGQVLTADSAETLGLKWSTASSYTAPTIGSTLISSGATVTTIAGLTLTAPIINLSINANTATTSTNIAGGVIGNVPYQTGAGATALLTNGLTGTVLTSGGVGAIPTWSAPSGATTVNVTDTNTNATYYPTFVSAAGTNQILYTDIATSALLYNPNTATLQSENITVTNTLRPSRINDVLASGGTSGQVLTSNGSSAPTWTTPTAYATVTDDTTTNATRYPLFAATTAGNLTTEYVSSTKYQFNPSTGVLTATQFSGSGAGLTSIPNSALTNSSITVGSTAISLGASATTIAGLTSVTSTTFVGALSGNASTATSATSATNATNTAVTDDTTTNATFYPTFVSNTTGNLPQTVSSTKLKFNPSTGALTVSQLIIAP